MCGIFEGWDEFARFFLTKLPITNIYKKKTYVDFWIHSWYEYFHAVIIFLDQADDQVVTCHKSFLEAYSLQAFPVLCGTVSLCSSFSTSSHEWFCTTVGGEQGIGSIMLWSSSLFLSAGRDHGVWPTMEEWEAKLVSSSLCFTRYMYLLVCTVGAYLLCVHSSLLVTQLFCAPFCLNNSNEAQPVRLLSKKFN